MAHAATNYEILGVPQNASRAAIRKAFELRLNTLHPWAEQDADERWARQQILNRVTTAYNSLTHRRRARHH